MIVSQALIMLAMSVPQFEMLTGALPFQGKDRKETMNLILKWVLRNPVMACCCLTKYLDKAVENVLRPSYFFSPQGASGNASVLERRGPVTAQGFVQEEPCQQTRCGSLSYPPSYDSDSGPSESCC